MPTVLRNVKTAALVIAAMGGLASLGESTALAAGFEILRPHRAVYEVALKESTDRSGIDTMAGRIVYELNGNACDGISVKYRFVSRVNANGEIFTTDQQTASFESPDGSEYSFLTKTFVNEQLDRTVKGIAENREDMLVVSLDSPSERVIELPEAKFISSHLVEMIEKAKDGVPFFTTAVFDGGDGADEVLKTTNVIGRASQVAEILPGERKNAIEPLAGKKSWPVTIGYFDNDLDGSTEATPVYEVSFLLYESGISRKLTMRYPDYSLTGTLVSLEMLEGRSCEPTE